MDPKIVLLIGLILINIGCWSTAEAGEVVIRDGDRLLQTDSVGRPLYHKAQYVVKGRTIYRVNNQGEIQYHKPRLAVRTPIKNAGNRVSYMEREKPQR